MLEVNGITVKEFFDENTFTLSYVAWDNSSRDAVVIDPVLDIDIAGGYFFTSSSDALLGFIEERELNVHYILETHAHADHLSGASYIKKVLPNAKTGIGNNIISVQETFSSLLNLELDNFGSQFDQLFNDDEIVKAGSLSFKVLFTPGHTPACTSLLFDGLIFTGDALFMPDYGTGRCDFPSGSAEKLYDSIQKIYSLPTDTIICTGHDYLPNGRDLRFHCTVEESMANNIRLNESTSREDFIKFRSERDATLSAPKLLYPSLQVNICGGQLPNAESNGVRYLKTPLISKNDKYF